jgi:hypothetical protein
MRAIEDHDGGSARSHCDTLEVDLISTRSRVTRLRVNGQAPGAAMLRDQPLQLQTRYLRAVCVHLKSARQVYSSLLHRKSAAAGLCEYIHHALKLRVSKIASRRDLCAVRLAGAASSIRRQGSM